MPFLKVVPIQQKPKRGAIANRLRKDKSRGEKLFHFQLLETKTHFYLFNAERKLIKKFEKNNKVSILRQKREIRVFALGLFLEYDGSQKGIGGYTFD